MIDMQLPAILSLFGFAIVIWGLRQYLNSLDKEKVTHQHSDIADKVACLVCRNESVMLETFNFTVPKAISYVGALMLYYDEQDQKSEELQQLPELIERHTLVAAAGYSVDGIARREGEIRVFKDKKYFGHKFKGLMRWVELDFGLEKGLITQFVVDKELKQQSERNDSICRDCGFKSHAASCQYAPGQRYSYMCGSCFESKSKPATMGCLREDEHYVYHGPEGYRRRITEEKEIKFVPEFVDNKSYPMTVGRCRECKAPITQSDYGPPIATHYERCSICKRFGGMRFVPPSYASCKVCNASKNGYGLCDLHVGDADALLSRQSYDLSKLRRD